MGGSRQTGSSHPASDITSCSSSQLGALQRKLSEVESDFILREKDLQGSLEETRGNEKKLLDNSRNLEIKVLASQEEAAQLNLKLSASEGRVHALEAELARLEGLKRETEFKLSSLHSALRRTLGIGRAGRTPSPAVRGRSGSPRRTFSPLKGRVMSHGGETSRLVQNSALYSCFLFQDSTIHTRRLPMDEAALSPAQAAPNAARPQNAQPLLLENNCQPISTPKSYATLCGTSYRNSGTLRESG